MKTCLICGANVENSIFCSECGKFALKLKRYCDRCGAFTTGPDFSKCHSCHGKKLSFDRLFSLYIYSGAITTVISEMKYGKVRSFAHILGHDLAESVPSELLENRTVIFPPMKLFDKFFRGFNQAEIIAEKVADKHNLKLDIRLVKKTRRTKPQASLTFEKRQKNLKNAFKLSRDVRDERFLIVDDVSTTMSTINTIAELLKKNGAKSVNAITVARTSPYFS